MNIRAEFNYKICNIENIEINVLYEFYFMVIILVSAALPDLLLASIRE